MKRGLAQIGQSLERRWRGGHPFRPRLSLRRRIGMIALFVLLCAVIGAYWYLTDSDRVRGMAEKYLTEVLGGRVEVERANLSVFQGLRLDGVRVHADQSGDPDSVIFSARTFRVDYNPRALVQGQIEAAQIIAIGPHVRLTQDRDTGQWNYERILKAARDRKKPSTRPATMVFPEIILRDGRVDNGEVVAGRYRGTGSIGFEGRLSPSGSEGRYVFDVQCHGLVDAVGPAVRGSIVPERGQIHVTLRDFSFGRDARGMLPFDLRKWWEEHAVSGKIDVADVTYAPPLVEGGRPDWRVEMSFKGVAFRIRPEEWRSDRDNRATQRIAAAVGWMKDFEPAKTSAPSLLFQYLKTVPIRLDKGEGTFAFSDAGIEIRDLRGYIEGNGLEINGRTEGLAPDAPMTMSIRSIGPRHFSLPADPKYLWSMPPEVQEIWRRFKPVGSAKLTFDVKRAEPGGKPDVSGVVDIIDGEFTCDRFPYTLREARGQLVIGRDEANGMFLDLQNLRGKGKPGGPNADGYVTVNGLVDHLGPDPGMKLEIAAANVVSEPAVFTAMPMEVRDILKMFDAPGKGQYPQFAGAFKCWILRDPGKDKHITVNIDLDITRATGMLIWFAYPLDNVSAHVEIRDDYVDIMHARMNEHGTTLAIDGRVRWEDRLKTGEKIGTDLKLAVTGMPIDNNLMEALPPMRRKWLKAVGLGGVLDFGGRVYSDKAPDDIITDLELTLRKGTIWPDDKGVPAMTGIEGTLRLVGESLELKNLTANRGEGKVALNGMVSWKNEDPKVSLKGHAENLALDAGLYKVLPEPAQSAWDEIAPEGTVDIDASYAGGAGFASAADAGGFSLTVRPKKLSVTPKVAPYRLDDLTGSVHVENGKVKIADIRGHHDKAGMYLGGVGDIESNAWDFHVAGKDLPVDEAFHKGMPESIGSLLKSIEYKGSLSFDFPKLGYRPAAEKPTTSPATTQPAAMPGDIDFDGSVTMAGAELNPGVLITDAKGRVQVKGSVRGGRLHELAGEFAFDSAKVAGRDAEDLRAEIEQSAGDPTLKVKSLQGQLAGGAVAGEVDVTVPETGPTRYAVKNLVLRNADVRQVAGDESLNGKFTASLELEGIAGDVKSRRGRGDVLAQGQDMYKVPLLMGLLQVTNLSLPFTSPFRSATAQYVLQGEQVSFENIELTGDRIVMRGAGSINFENKKVRLTFNTDSPTHWINLPIFRDLVRTARRELFQISVRGTVEEPKISSDAFHTVTTTVDEVFNGDRGER